MVLENDIYEIQNLLGVVIVQANVTATDEGMEEDLDLQAQGVAHGTDIPDRHGEMI